MPIIRFRRVVACVLLMGSGCFAQKEAESLCHVLGRLEEYSKQLVRVRTKIESGRTGTWLAAETGCPVRIKAGEFTFANLMAFMWPDDTWLGPLDLKLPFSADSVSVKLLRAAVAKPRVRIDAIVEGFVLTNDPPLALVSERNPKITFGFGHEGGAPAAMVVKRLSDVRVTYRRENGKVDVMPVKSAQ